MYVTVHGVLPFGMFCLIQAIIFILNMHSIHKKTIIGWFILLYIYIYIYIINFKTIQLYYFNFVSLGWNTKMYFVCMCVYIYIYVYIYTHTLQNIGIKQYILSLYKVIIVMLYLKYLPLSTGAIKFSSAIFFPPNTVCYCRMNKMFYRKCHQIYYNHFPWTKRSWISKLLRYTRYIWSQ